MGRTRGAKGTLKSGVPKAWLRSKRRRAMWREAEAVLRAVSAALPVSRVHAMGSFTTRKRRPADVDFVVVLRVPPSRRGQDWSFDLVLAPEGKHGDRVVKDVRAWMRQKYGRDGFGVREVPVAKPRRRRAA